MSLRQSTYLRSNGSITAFARRKNPALLERLAAEQVPLTVCPLSNVNLGVFARLEEHNIARLLHRGIAVSLHSDDPPYFGGYLSHCF